MDILGSGDIIPSSSSLSSKSSQNPLPLPPSPHASLHSLSPLFFLLIPVCRIAVACLAFLTPGSFALPPAPHPVARYQPLWEQHLFEEQLPAHPGANESGPKPTPAAPASYKLIGLATVDEETFAYVQPRLGGRVIKVPSGPEGDVQLLEVNPGEDQQITSIRFRKEGEILLAEFSRSSKRLPSRSHGGSSSRSRSSSSSSHSASGQRASAPTPNKRASRENFLRAQAELYQQRLAASREQAGKGKD